MEIRKLTQTIELAEALKNNTYHSWTSKERHENVAEHSWRLCLFAYFIRDEFPETDIDRVPHMCLFHNTGKASTGDIPSFQKTEADEVRETQVIYEWVNGLPAPYNTELRVLYEKMNALEILEARIYKALDRMKVLMQHNQSDLPTRLPLEYELSLKYGVEQAEFHDYLRELRQMVFDGCIAKVKQENPKKYRELGWGQPRCKGSPTV